jgi:hypothetical protein
MGRIASRFKNREPCSSREAARYGTAIAIPFGSRRATGDQKAPWRPSLLFPVAIDLVTKLVTKLAGL